MRRSWRDISADQLLRGVTVPREIRDAFLRGETVYFGIVREYGGGLPEGSGMRLRRFGAPRVNVAPTAVAVRMGDGSPMSAALEFLLASAAVALAVLAFTRKPREA